MTRPRIRKYGDNAILMEWEAIINPTINDQVLTTANYLDQNHTEFILEIVPSYQSLVVFLKEGVDIDRYLAILLNGKIGKKQSITIKRTWEIPVCYDFAFGLDLQSFIDAKNLTQDQIVRLHTQPDYRIYGIGFMPGFLYLGGLNEQLFAPRGRVVKRFSPKGSVAIGGEQTGIYPQESLGGWNIIGRTPLELFSSSTNPPMPFSIGDLVRFYPINKSEFDQIESAVSSGNHQLKPIPND